MNSTRHDASPREVAPWMKVSKFEKATDKEILSFEPLLRHIIRVNDYGSELNYDELFAIGLVAIAVALERYDETKHVTLSAWVGYQIDMAIRNERRKVVNQRKRGAVLAKEETEDERDPIEALAYVESEIDKIAEREEREVTQRYMREAVDALDETERVVILGLYFGERSQCELAVALGVSQSWVSRIAKRALKRMRYYVEAQREQRDASARDAARRRKYYDATR